MVSFSPQPPPLSSGREKKTIISPTLRNYYFAPPENSLSFHSCTATLSAGVLMVISSQRTFFYSRQKTLFHFIFNLTDSTALPQNLSLFRRAVDSNPQPYILYECIVYLTSRPSCQLQHNHSNQEIHLNINHTRS